MRIAIVEDDPDQAALLQVWLSAGGDYDCHLFEDGAKAIKALGINVPIYTTRIVGGRMELTLYGGRIVYYPDPPPTKA